MVDFTASVTALRRYYLGEVLADRPSPLARATEAAKSPHIQYASAPISTSGAVQLQVNLSGLSQDAGSAGLSTAQILATYDAASALIRYSNANGETIDFKA